MGAQINRHWDWQHCVVHHKKELITNMQNRLVHHLIGTKTPISQGHRFPLCIMVHNAARWCMTQVDGAQLVLYTLNRKSPRWCVFTQAWGYIVITSYLGVFKFACVISRGFGLLLNKVYYILTLHVKILCKIRVNLDLFSQAMSLCNYTKVVWLWWYTPRYLFLLRVYSLGGTQRRSHQFRLTD